MSLKKITLFLGILTILISSPISSLWGQVRAGAAFLKMLPGARVQSMATAHTAVLDEPFSHYVNPAATGLLRDWYWAASYSKWIADIYNASFILSKRVRNPISQKTRFALGVIYQGMPEFDSSDGAAALVSANDLLFSFSIGQPLSAISQNISSGLNIKYLKSTLDSYTANSFVFDAGILARTPKFRLHNPLFPYGIFSAGVAYTQLGSDLKFDRIDTPLPKTFRAGLAFHAGSHFGLQLHLTGDYVHVKDEKNGFAVGVEANWANRFSINGGYDFNSDLMSQISLGCSLQLDDIITPRQFLIPGRNNGLRFELASVDEGEFFARTYRGDLAHLPIGPEPFDFICPANDDTIQAKKVILKWQFTADPDLFDDVHYSLFLTQDSAKLANLINSYFENTDAFFNSISETPNTIRYFSNLKADSLLLTSLVNGFHYWSVLAEDMDKHVRFAQTLGKRIYRFYVTFPDIEIKKINFQYSPWITEDDYHGEIEITIANNSDSPIDSFSIAIYDSTCQSVSPFLETDRIASNNFLKQEKIDELSAKETITIKLPWHTIFLGQHRIKAVVDVSQQVTESNEENNFKAETIYTIPKGFFATRDTVPIFFTSRAMVDYPLVTEVCFDPHSSNVKPDYLFSTEIQPTLRALAIRLKQNPEMTIAVRGFIDPNSDEIKMDLATQRAQAIKDTLIRLNVNPNQIATLAGEAWQKRAIPQNPQDAVWVFEERRNVTISTDSAYEKVLFHPLRKIDDEDTSQAVCFHLKLRHALASISAQYYCYRNQFQDSASVDDLKNKLTIDQFNNWSPNLNDSAAYANKSINYYFSLTDSLGRNFRTYEKNCFLTKKIVFLSHKIVLPMQFAKTNASQSFLWQMMLAQIDHNLAKPQKRFRFSGHACAVGPDWINKNLSQQRVERFMNEFKAYLDNNKPSEKEEILKRLDMPLGFGEEKPLAIEKRSGSTIILGDNNSPTGRILNRRIEMEIYSREK